MQDHHETDKGATSHIRRWLAEPERYAAAAAASGDPGPLLALAATTQTTGRSEQ
jgi:hypothetical protein